MDKILTKKALPGWVKKLGSYKVYFPRKEEERWNYAQVVGGADTHQGCAGASGAGVTQDPDQLVEPVVVVPPRAEVIDHGPPPSR